MERTIGYQMLNGNIMKAFQVIIIVLLFAAASAAYVWLRPDPATSSATEPGEVPAASQVPESATAAVTNGGSGVPEEPARRLEERGDAMLFEIDALVNTPFDESIVQPLD